MGSLDPAKILVILVVALVVIGPDRLPRAARQLGRAWHELTRARDQVVDEVRAALPDDLPRVPANPARHVAAFWSDLTAEARIDQAGAEATLGTVAAPDEDVPVGARARVVEAPGMFDDPSMN